MSLTSSRLGTCAVNVAVFTAQGAVRTRSGDVGLGSILITEQAQSVGPQATLC